MALDSAPVTRTSRRQGSPSAAGRRNRWGLLTLPAVVILGLFFLWPLGEMAARSVTDPSVGLDNYQKLLTTPVALRSIWTTISTSLAITVVSGVIGYAYAYAMLLAKGRVSALLFVCVLLPAWLSLLVRTFAWQVILRDTGLINSFLLSLGVIDGPIPLIRTPFAVAIGMTSILLPFMVLPIYAVMRRIEPDLPIAAGSLGAPPIRSFLLVFLPLSMPGLLAGSLLVFVSALGFYITPALLGSGRDVFLSQLVQQAFAKVEWGYGSAIGITLLGITLLVLAIASRFVKIGDAYGVGTGE
jgi:putative spermidine/putrescine transport system permease protein